MKCFLARAKLIWAILKVLMWVLSQCFGLFFFFFGGGWLLRGVISGKHIGINVQRLIIAIRKMIMLIIISSNIFASQYLLLKNIKTWSRTVLRKDGIPMSRCHFSTWINCLRDRRHPRMLSASLEWVPWGFRDRGVQRGFTATRNLWEKVLLKPMLTMNWFLSIINGRNPL